MPLFYLEKELIALVEKFCGEFFFSTKEKRLDKIKTPSYLPP